MDTGKRQSPLRGQCARESPEEDRGQIRKTHFPAKNMLAPQEALSKRGRWGWRDYGRARRCLPPRLLLPPSGLCGHLSS